MSDADTLHLTSCSAAAVPLGTAVEASEAMAETRGEEKERRLQTRERERGGAGEETGCQRPEQRRVCERCRIRLSLPSSLPSSCAAAAAAVCTERSSAGRRSSEPAAAASRCFFVCLFLPLLQTDQKRAEAEAATAVMVSRGSRRKGGARRQDRGCTPRALLRPSLTATDRRAAASVLLVSPFSFSLVQSAAQKKAIKDFKAVTSAR